MRHFSKHDEPLHQSGIQQTKRKDIGEVVLEVFHPTDDTRGLREREAPSTSPVSDLGHWVDKCSP